MNNRQDRSCIGTAILLLFIVLCFFPVIGNAEQDYVVAGKDYVLPENSNYDYTNSAPTNKFFYGAASLGKLHIKGLVEKNTTYNDHIAYGATGTLSIHYDYDGSYLNTKLDSWHVENDGTRWIRDYDVGFLNNIAKGCIMIEKSSNARNWEKVINPIKNYFDKAKSSSESLVLTIPEEDYKNGMYYRVVVAYKFARRTKEAFLNDQYDRRKCVEVYEFYVASEKNYVKAIDLANKADLQDKAVTNAGFQLHKNGSNATVTVNGSKKEALDFDLFTEPGEYRINIRTRLGKEYNCTITVDKGLDFTSLKPTIYESEKDKGFPLTKSVTVPALGSSLTTLSLAIPKGYEIKQDHTSYGITGDQVSLYLKLNQGIGSIVNGWTLSSSGKKQVNGIDTGEVGSGALIIQTSKDGKTWTNVEKFRYERGLYTTHYAVYYKNGQSVLIYTPSGMDVIAGLHIRVLYAYQVKKVTKDEYRDCVEVYEFYLCSDELGAVTFHNLSVAETVKESFDGEDETTVEVYQQAETLIDGSYTTTGFQIDKKRNPTVKHIVMRNGVSPNGDKNSYEETGKYDIKLTSAVGSTKQLTIYVDRMEPEDAMKQYFGEGFVSGKRIFTEGEYPVFEGGETSWHVAAVGDNILPLYGQIRNMSTGTVITVEQTRDEKTDVFFEPGFYEAVFATSKSLFLDKLAGDARVFTFRFQIIEQGTAPGPVVNQKLLSDYSHSTVSDSNPVYYGLTYTSAEKGKITLAFANKEDAVAYAYEYEKGLVEKQENGSYRYSGALIVDQNVKYDSAWDLTDAVNYFAEAAVHKHYFDMSDEFTYLSLTDEDLEKYTNLRQLELPRSVTIFAEGQKEKLTGIDALPLLNDKPYAYLNPETGEVNSGYYSYQLITDQYGGIDSASVTITDSQGGRHSIRYSESVGQQLLADNCPSGIVTIHEETKYGDTTEYKAVYIDPEDNQTELTVEYAQDEDRKTIVLNNSMSGADIDADSFRISGLSDPMDPCAFVIVKHNQYEYAFTAKESPEIVWSDPGKYSITCRNRMGYGYTVSVTIEAPEGYVEPEQNTPASAQATKEPAPVSASEEKPQPTATEGIPMPTDAPARTVEIEETQSGNDSNMPVITGIAAGLILVAVLGVLAYRRIRLFSRTAENMKSEGENKHE